MIKVSCFKYEDDEDENQNLITMYLILVEDKKRNTKYTVHKRYSDFLQLYLSLRERSPELEAFRFPNKSIFNNHSR
jgi:PX domain